MSTINVKLLAEVYAALTVAENQMRDVGASNYDLAAWLNVMTARSNLAGALDRLPPVFVSVTEPAAVPDFLKVPA